jgi:tetratricopeptide (TPR) repeat protein
LSDYNRFIELNPEHVSGYINRGIVYVRKKLYDMAIEDFDRAISRDKESANAYFNKALVCEKVGKIKEAIEAYKNFINYATPKLASYVDGAKDRIVELEKVNNQ